MKTGNHMLVNIQPSIREALSHTLQDSDLSYTQYQLSRQIGILSWLNTETSRGRDYTIGRSVVSDQIILHNDFFHTYDLDIDGKSILMQVWIVGTQSLAEEYPLANPVCINPDYPNLYVAQRSGTNERIAFEISADETTILHQVLRHQSSYSHYAIDKLTCDPELRQAILDAQQSLEGRLKRMSMPFVTFGSDDDVHLYFPTDTTLYHKQLEWLLSHGHFDNDHNQEPRPQGYVARRLRELDMVRNVGSITGVYGNMAKPAKWEEMGLVERAYHEDRIVGSGDLEADGSNIKIMVIMRDRLNDGIGQHIIVSNSQIQNLVTVGIDGVVESIASYNEDISEYASECKPLTFDQLADQCENWYYGLRVSPWISVLFEILEVDAEILPRFVMNALTHWLK